MKVWSRRVLVALLFAALVVALLWFQGLLFRHEPELVTVPPAPALARGARTARVMRVELERLQSHPGYVEAEESVPVAARVLAAVLTVERREGEAIAAGELLATLDERDAGVRLSQAEAARTAARALSEQAELAFQRADRLRAAEALTTAEWEGARAAREAAAAEVARVKELVREAEIARTWYRVEAPFAGRILARHVEPGALIGPGQPLVTLYDPARLRFTVALPEARASELVAGRELALEFERLGARRATLTRILPPADARTGTVTLHCALADASELRPGQLGRLLLGDGTRTALFVPAAAVTRIGQIERVELVRDGRHEPVTVRTGRAHGETLEVLSGLSEGEEVLLP